MPNRMDSDSIADIIELNGFERDGNGYVDGFRDVAGGPDGMDDGVLSLRYQPVDEDGNSVFDHVDIVDLGEQSLGDDVSGAASPLSPDRLADGSSGTVLNCFKCSGLRHCQQRAFKFEQFLVVDAAVGVNTLLSISTDTFFDMRVGRAFVLILCLPLLAACVSLDYVFPKTAQTTTSTMLVAPGYAGKSSPDNDGDPGRIDNCSDLANEILEDVNGCGAITGVIEGLEFAPDDVQLSIEAKAALDRVTNAILRYPDVVISVTSHTDNRGSAADNLALSKQRLNAVISYMVATGIEAQRLQPFAYGESRPRAANATLDGRERNRRIEIEVIERLP
ncbi:MAG: outer membrane protein OmpA-like peptidoglycan-associated protein [Granulosicoccus sp.]|jgi:outer membrane protein OmpA-like peptidoglycan-associated protein